MGIKVVSVCLTPDLIDIIDELKEKRGDPSRSNTIRDLLLQKIAEMSLLPSEQKKALGIKLEA